MKIHLMSDIHLEAYKNADEAPFPSVTGDVCILAGDIGTIYDSQNLYDYFARIKDNFNEVIWVLGNHEFYHTPYDDTLEFALGLATHSKVRLLDYDLGTADFEYNGVTFYGSTLWTDFNNRKDSYVISKTLNDFRLVPGLTTDRAYDIHTNTSNNINWDADVVITHHMPILRQHTRFPVGAITYGFCCTQLEDRIENSNIKYWLYGHTHDNISHTVGNTKILTNQVGYQRELGPYVSYDSNLIIEI